MNPSFQCILLLACITITICNSIPMTRCRCPNPKQIPKAINRTLIADVIQYKPRPYCNRYEVIVTLKNKTKTCLDPKSKFTIALLQAKERMEANRKKHSMKITAATPTSGATSSYSTKKRH
ncbi:C-X-C motif chemokine 9-like [Cyprinodon tularosa]|uniref:C-X-C motif chemokine 9-like n=1 Tax=Cyprinodon tularosa TaxID=77115 RepID=UPI0018E2576F|nr:C-X-C motif chemokine 9-like [Cyprinodon tularosa]